MYIHASHRKVFTVIGFMLCLPPLATLKKYTLVSLYGPSLFTTLQVKRLNVWLKDGLPVAFDRSSSVVWS